MAKRLQAMGQPNYRDSFAVRVHDHILEVPARWAKPRMVFVNSMGDLFHENVSIDFIRRVFEVMERTPRHTYQLLTKRADRLAEIAPVLGGLETSGWVSLWRTTSTSAVWSDSVKSRRLSSSCPSSPYSGSCPT